MVVEFFYYYYSGLLCSVSWGCFGGGLGNFQLVFDRVSGQLFFGGIMVGGSNGNFQGRYYGVDYGIFYQFSVNGGFVIIYWYGIFKFF